MSLSGEKATFAAAAREVRPDGVAESFGTDGKERFKPDIMDKNCSFSSFFQEASSAFPEVRKEIVEYVCAEVIPKYAAFDPAHREDHAEAVISNAMDLYRRAPEEVRAGINPEILFVAAACHDLGRINGKARHHIDSGIIIRRDARLREWFDDGAIELIAQAAEDHRASNDSEPRSIYGKMVAEADRLIDSETIIRRTLQYGLSAYPEMSPDEQIDRALDHLYAKYGCGGYLKLWIPWSSNTMRLLELRSLLADHEAARDEVVRIWRSLRGEA